ncbi:XRE family transcriptional regulator [Lactobacillus sp. ESL0679]|uniref:XRE family transcriptional regulator n=1 Tax=Lactobacillus sp. ESL0679 TaxID=2983209 RepID=UPI0023F67FFA|nr:XRE family transcriptional regulator [Lactobacillus sp. ESL0679]MDF7682127.1 XRE family transcriptional regulator [Lactobacillus sp. ESL0679]
MENVFVEQLIKLRRKQRLSQNDLAQKLYISRQSISKWELGETEPDINKLIMLAAVFGVSLDYLLLGTPTNRDILLKMTNLKKAFTYPVLKRINLTIMERDRIALLGSNGAGKSTLIKIIARLLQPDSGKVEFFYNPQTDLKIMPQENVLLDGLKVDEQIRLEAAIDHVYDRKQITALLEQFNLKQQAKVTIKKLSGGQKRRLLLLLTLIRPSKFLILDEPTAGMDLQSIDFFWQCLDRVNSTVLTTTHDFNQIDKYFSRVVLLKDGEIIQDASVDTVHSHHQTIEQWYRHFNDEKEQTNNDD